VSKTARSISEHLNRTQQPLMTPKGMGDLLPPHAAQRRELAGKLLKHFALAGYELVTPPLFEHASVVEEGNETVDPRDLLRFVEPETGEVAVLRPDITPQVARMVATRLTDRPTPYHLCYEGRVLHHQRGRAHKHRQITQIGLECIGIASPSGDVETIAMAAEACQGVGLKDFRIELCTSALVGSVMASIPAADRERIAECVGSKDGATLRALGRDAKLSKMNLERLETLLTHYGDLSVLASARKAFRFGGAQETLANLQAIADGLTRRGLGEKLHVDLSETRGLTYYTGASFQIFAEGPGETICSGGRYDNLLARYGRNLPATGFALDLENLQWALREAGKPFSGDTLRRLALVEPADNEAHLPRILRAHGVAVATLPAGTSDKDALAFTKSWGYAAMVVPSRGATRAHRILDGASRKFNMVDKASVPTLIEWAFANQE